jgi:D-alanyl-D-alanine carboxypeptidase/D-alanyl-D-alanine-endopeptidase (penicillin-binding protein 4)
MPASTLKTLTLAVTADRLGWDFAYETRAFPIGSVVNGVLDGDLLVVGAGDPSFNDRDGSATEVFQSWASRLKELGIQTIGGRIIGVDNVFDDDGLGAGWMWDDMAEDYSAAASGLQFNEGTAQVIVTPGPSIGEPAVLALSPSHARVPLVNGVTTAAAGTPTAIAIGAFARMPGASLKGVIAVDSASQTRVVTVGNPTLYFANAVRTTMIASGIDVLGGAADADDLADIPATPAIEAPLAHRSAPLSSLADQLMKISDNLYAETFLRTLGATQRANGSATAGIEVVKETLASWGVPPSEIVMADGSGLSRYNLVTANALVSTLTHVYADDALRGPFLATLPVAGRPGMLGRRMQGTKAEGNVQAKTGSFTNARAVAGFMRTSDGEPLVFAVMANNYGVPAAAVDRVTDAVLVALAEFRR